MPYKPDENFVPMQPGDVRTLTFDSNYDLDIIFTSDNVGNIADTFSFDPAIPQDISIDNLNRADLSISNFTGKKIENIYLKDRDLGGKYFGGSIISPESSLPSEETMTFKVPTKGYYVILKDDQNTFYWRSVFVWIKKYLKTKLDYYNSSQALNSRLNNQGSTDICSVRLHRYDDLDEKSMELPITFDNPPNLIDFFGGDPIAKGGGKLEFKLEPGRYYIEAKDCSGKTVFKGSSVEVRGNTKTIPIGIPCNTVGSVKVGNKEYSISCPNNPNTSASSTAVWTDCYSIIEVVADAISLNFCVNGSLWDLLTGIILIDPDGYVYDAAQGIEAVIQGSTVTCDVYDEDYQTWERWPAELYEAQINPQVTGTDGYYAFFVPPGLYRVRAVAGGYDSHTSPDIRVIDEIVHYNIPMTGGGGIFLPFVVRSAGPPAG